jgi:hypothetical protein
LIDEELGIKHLFQTFTMKPDTINKLRGKGHEISDLQKIVSHYKNWHMQHCPKLEYYYFLEKIQKMGKDKEVEQYLNKLRNHYKGEELMEEF